VNGQKQEQASEREWEQGQELWNGRKWGEPGPVKGNEREPALKNAEEPVKSKGKEPAMGNAEERVKDCGRDPVPENEEEQEMGRGQARAK
jgi:hypothetical protein